MKLSLTPLSPTKLGRKVPGSAKLLWKDERGLSTVEYIVLLAVIVVGAIGIWKSIGGSLMESLHDADEQLGDLAP